VRILWAIWVVAAGCGSTGGAGPSGGTTGGGPDGGLRPGETCNAKVACGGTSTQTYQQCTVGSGASCAQRYLGSDGSSFACASCTDCMTGAQQIGAWCMNKLLPDGGIAADDSKCPMMPTTNTKCIQCCETAHPAGAQFVNDQVLKCECTSPGACRTSCNGAGNYCSGGQADLFCDSCIQNNTNSGGTCDITPQCSTNTDCMALLSCAGNCPP
jgi:hypothetical protein